LTPIPGKSLAESELFLDTALIHSTSITSIQELVEKPKGENYGIVIINDAIQRQRTKAMHTAELETVEQLRVWKIEEEQVFIHQADIIRNCGASIVIATGKVHEMVANQLEKYGILCIAGYNDLNQLNLLCKMSGASIVHRIDDLSLGSVGKVLKVEKVNIAQRDYTKILVKSKVKCCTLVIRGSTIEQCEEYVRHCHDALYTVESMYKRKKPSKFIPGGGSFELNVTVSLNNYAKKLDAVNRVGVRCYAEAFEIIPRTLCENAALNVDKTISNLLRMHREGNNTVGIPACQYVADKNDGQEFDMIRANIFDSFVTKEAVVKAATSIACTILRINNTIPAKPR
jgi:chaperonin GroEL (HSP60 family)